MRYPFIDTAGLSSRVAHSLAAIILPFVLAASLVGRADDAQPASAGITVSGGTASDLQEYSHRHDALSPTSVDERVALAHWAQDHHLWPQTAAVAKEALDRDSDNREAWRILHQVDALISLPTDPVAEKSLVSEFSAHYASTFKTRNSRHFLICYDTSDAFAARRGTSLEQAYDAFLFSFTMNKLRPNFLDHRLIVILFQRRQDYLEYATRTEGADLGWSAGYYSQRTNRAAFYDDSTGPEAVSIDQMIKKYRAQIQVLNTQISQASGNGNSALADQLSEKRNALGQAIYQFNLRVGNALGTLNNSKTVHEAVHQLSFNTGIQTRLVDYPLWLCEGIATCFETETASNNARGPLILNTERLPVIKEALARGVLVPIDRFITQALPQKMTSDDLSLFYAESWALFHYLYKSRRTGMENFLLTYNADKPLRVFSDDERRAQFTAAFGPNIAVLQKGFEDYLRSLPVMPQH